jgi:hypothetical protein
MALDGVAGEVLYPSQGLFTSRWLRDVIGVDNMMWGSDYPHSESTFPQSRKILAEILAGVPDDEQAKPAPTPIRGSPAATPLAPTILTWRG